MLREAGEELKQRLEEKMAQAIDEKTANEFKRAFNIVGSKEKLSQTEIRDWGLHLISICGKQGYRLKKSGTLDEENLRLDLVKTGYPAGDEPYVGKLTVTLCFEPRFIYEYSGSGGAIEQQGTIEAIVLEAFTNGVDPNYKKYKE